MAFWQRVSDYVGDEVEVRGFVYFRDDDGVEVGGAEDCGEVFEGEARGDGIDADGELGDVGGSAGLREEGEDVGAGGGFLGGGHAVFEVVGDGVYG